MLSETLEGLFQKNFLKNLCSNFRRKLLKNFQNELLKGSSEFFLENSWNKIIEAIPDGIDGKNLKGLLEWSRKYSVRIHKLSLELLEKVVMELLEIS